MIQPVKLIAVDLDGTILHSDGTVSPFTIEVFHRLRNCGISTCILTARRKASAETICSQLACRGIALYNGAVLIADSRVIVSQPMNWLSAKTLLTDAGDHKCSVSCESGTVYTNYKAPHSVWLDSWSQLPERNLLRIVLYQASQKLMEQLTARSYAELHIQQLAHGDIVVVSKSATKEQALKILMEHWGVYSEETVGFGDDISDLGFITLAGTGIAVENAVEQIRQKADMVCGCNNEDGPALWLNEHILKPYGLDI